MKINTRKHLERSQPLKRQKYGLLEKHKDYKLRSNDYHRKQSRLKALKEKARYKNEDEFYHAMIHGHLNKQGVHIRSVNKSAGAEIKDRLRVFDGETLKLLKSQDLKYVSYCLDVNAKNMLKLKDELKAHGIVPPAEYQEGPANSQTPKHTKFQPDDADDNSVEAKENEIEANAKVVLEKQDQKIKRKLLIELKARMERHEALKKTEHELQVQKNLMTSKGRYYKLSQSSDSNGNAQYKWRQERSK